MRQFEQRVVAKRVRIAKVGQRVLGGIAADAARGLLVEQPRLADQVETDVGHRDVFFEDRPVAAPLGVALSEDQRIIGKM